MHQGMYGAFIIDPDPARHPEHADTAHSRLKSTPENARWQEFVTVMIARSRPVRTYLVDVTKFDANNSLHLHGNFFDDYGHGTTLTPPFKSIDTVMQCQAQRCIFEFTIKDHEVGQYMFHAQQFESAELSWMGLLSIVETTA